MSNEVIAFSSSSSAGGDGQVVIRCRLCGKEIARQFANFSTATCAECAANDENKVVTVAPPEGEDPNPSVEESQWKTKSFRALGFLRRAAKTKPEATQEAQRKKRKPLLLR